MRVFALSDVHVDYAVNQQWITQLSAADFRNDLLILAGDVCDSIPLLESCMSTLVGKFARVLYVPGNHELWVHRDQSNGTSLEKFEKVCTVVKNCGATMRPFHWRHLSIAPLLGWYDYSFGEPSADLLAAWVDYTACRWPAHFSVRDIAAHFLGLNDEALQVTNQTIISFSHFVPRLDLLPNYVRGVMGFLHPVLGSTTLETQIRQLRPAIHVYGHSHINRRISLDNVLYVNNAFGYPHETSITAKELVCIYEG